MLKDFKDEDFENKIKNEKVSVILYSAIWCNPCKIYKPVLSKLSDSEEFKDKANFYYGDIENAAINAASSAGIRSIPTTVIYKLGQEVDRMTGYPGEAHAKEFLSKNI